MPGLAPARPWMVARQQITLELSNKMKSNKQRRLEIKAKRRKRTETINKDLYKTSYLKPLDSIEADQYELMHNHEYAFLPTFYLDKPFKCRDCGAIEIWKATSQKWWYEVAKGNIESTAIHCSSCRTQRKLKKEEQKKHMELMAQRVPHPNESFFRKRY